MYLGRYVSTEGTCNHVIPVDFLMIKNVSISMQFYYNLSFISPLNTTGRLCVSMEEILVFYCLCRIRTSRRHTWPIHLTLRRTTLIKLTPFLFYVFIQTIVISPLISLSKFQPLHICAWLFTFRLACSWNFVRQVALLFHFPNQRNLKLIFQIYNLTSGFYLVCEIISTCSVS
jgi:hypothetical protein